MEKKFSKFKKVIIPVAFLTTLVFSHSTAFASELKDVLKINDYSPEFKAYLELSEEEKKNVVMPRPYVVNFPMDIATYSTEEEEDINVIEKYDLRDIINDNLEIRNQMSTQLCWTFSALSSLETNLAMQDLKRGITTNVPVYNFSERHMEYSSTYKYLDKTLDRDAFKREIDAGGTFLMALAYFVNGRGPILEEDMPFENNANLIAFEDMPNKKPEAQVLDTVDFPSIYSADENGQLVVDASKISEISTLIKQHVKNYGSVYAAIFGATFESDYYNNDTAALYCDADFTPNHAVSIIGWDDNYSKENFLEEHRPENDGAWIIRNSWGSRIDIFKEQVVAELFEALKDRYGWQSYEEVTDEIIEKVLQNTSFIVEKDEEGNVIGAYTKVGDNGFMYVSYEDMHIYFNLWGVSKSALETDYDNIYYYDALGMNNEITIGQETVYTATEFEKGAGVEFLTAIGATFADANCVKVYINPNGNSKNFEDFIQVNFEDGEEQTIKENGYHTLKFEKPVLLTSSSFVVMVEYTGNEKVVLPVETNIPGTFYELATIEDNKCFISLDATEWQDLSKLTTLEDGPLAGCMMDVDSCIRAFTINKYDGDALNDKPKFDLTATAISDGQLIRGSEFTVVIGVDNFRNTENGILAISGMMEFDTNVLELQEASMKGINGWNFSSIDYNINTFKFVAESGKYTNETKQIIEVSFKVKADAELGSTAIKFTNIKGGTGEIANGIAYALNNELEMNIEDDKFFSNEYNIDEDTNIISKVKPNTSLEDFISNLETTYKIRIINKDGKILGKGDKIATGDTLMIIGTDKIYKISVTGDLDGDSEITANDLAMIKLHIIKKQILKNEYFEAAKLDIDEDVTINDLAMIKLVLIKKIEL